MFKVIKPCLIPVIMTCLSVYTWNSHIYCRSIDTLEAIYKVLGERNMKMDIYDKRQFLIEKGIDFKENIHLIAPFRAYVKRHHNTQLEIYTILLINYAYYVKHFNSVDFQELESSIKLALSQDDKFVAANTFWMCAELYYGLDNFEASFVYSYSALETFKEIGALEFSRKMAIYNALAWVSYQIGEYRNSVNYSLKCYKNTGGGRTIFTRKAKIYLLDIIGVGYKKLNMPDSSIYFYEEILCELEQNRSLYGDYWIELWIAIAKGNIGENYLNQGKLAEASEFINYYYKKCKDFNDTLNICLSRNVYARLLALQGKKDKAIKIWKSILPIKIAHRNMAFMKEVNSHLAQAYRNKRKIDSAFYFHEQRDIYLSRIHRRNLTSGLKKIKEQYAFNRLSENVLHLGKKVAYLKRSRLYITGIILLSSALVIVLFYFRRKRLKQKYEIQRYKRAMVEQELSISEERNLTLKDRLLERNNLASYLIKQIRGMEQNEDASTLINEIKDYTLAKVY